MANPITQIILSAVDRTKAVFTSVKGGLASIGSSAAGLTSQLGLIFTGLSVAGFVGSLKNAIDKMDEAYASAQKIGTSVENFSALSYAAKQSNVPVEELEKSLLKLARGIDAAKEGSGPAAEAFARLGIDPKQFSDPADALLVIADRFASMPNGVNKAALAMDLFGKSGADLIPLLNEGGAGIKRMTDEAERFGVVIRTEAAAAADQFNDNLDKLKETGSGLGITLANEMLPGLAQVTEAMAQAAKESGLLMAGIVGLGGLGAGLFTDELLTNTQKLANEKERLNEIIRGSLFLDTAAIAKQKGVIQQLEASIAAEKALGEQRRKDGKDTSKDLAENHKAEAKAFKDSINEQISDAQRLQGALQSAFAAALSEQEQYTKEAKKLRADAANSTDGKDQSELKLDGTLATMKLERTKANGSPEEIRDQAAAVKELATAIEDQTQKKFMLERANLAEAAAADQSAAAAGQQAAAIAAQMTANEGRMAEAKKASDDIGKPVSLDVVPSAQTDASIAKLTEIKNLIDYIKNTPVSVGGAANGTGGMSEALRTEALKRGNRR